MGRYYSGAAGGALAAGGSSNPAYTTTLPSGEAIAANALVAIANDNNCYQVVDPAGSAGGSAWRPFVQGSTAYGVAQGTAPLNDTNSSGHGWSAKLNNGNIATAYIRGGGTTAWISITNPGGQSVLKPTQIDTGVYNGSPIGVCALSGGGFAVGYWSGTSSVSGFTAKIFDANGTLQGTYSAATETNIPQSNFIMAGLANGNFAAYYFQSSSSQLRLAVISSAATAILAFNTISGSSPNTGMLVALAALASGGFVVYWNETAGTSLANTYFKIYDSTGTAVVGKTSSAIQVYGVETMSVVGLTGGGFMIAAGETVSSNSGVKAAVYNASGVLQGATVTLSTATIGSTTPIYLAAGTDGSGYASWNDTQNNIAKISAAGALVGNIISVSSSIAAGAVNGLTAGDDGGVVFAAPVNSGSTSQLAVVAFNSSLSQTYQFNLSLGFTLANQVAMFEFAGGALSPTPYITLGFYTTGATYVNAYAYRVLQQVVIGVSEASAIAGGSVPVQYSGQATLATAFLQPYTFNGQGAAPPGNKLSVVGNSVLMSGIQPAATRSIN